MLERGASPIEEQEEREMLSADEMCEVLEHNCLLLRDGAALCSLLSALCPRPQVWSHSFKPNVSFLIRKSSEHCVLKAAEQTCVRESFQ